MKSPVSPRLTQDPLIDVPQTRRALNFAISMAFLTAVPACDSPSPHARTGECETKGKSVDQPTDKADGKRWIPFYKIAQSNDKDWALGIDPTTYEKKFDSTQWDGANSPDTISEERRNIIRIFFHPSLMDSLPLALNDPKVRPLVQDNVVTFLPLNDRNAAGSYHKNIEGSGRDLIVINNGLPNYNFNRMLNDLSVDQTLGHLPLSFADCASSRYDLSLLCSHWERNRSTLIHELIHDWFTEGISAAEKEDLENILIQVSVGENQSVKEWQRILTRLQMATGDLEEWQIAFKLANHYANHSNVQQKDKLTAALAWAFLVKKRIVFAHFEGYQRDYMTENNIPEKKTPYVFAVNEVYAFLFDYKLLLPGLEPYFSPLLYNAEEFKPDLFNEKEPQREWWEKVSETELQKRPGYVWASLKKGGSFGMDWNSDMKNNRWTMTYSNGSEMKKLNLLRAEDDKWLIHRKEKLDRTINYDANLTVNNPFITTKEGFKVLGQMLTAIYKAETSPQP